MGKANQGQVTFQRDGAVGVVILSRPGKLNSMTRAMFQQLAEAVKKAGSDRAARVLIIRGDEGAFCAGDDLAELVRLSPESVREFLIMGQDILTGIESLPFPVLAAVDGFCLGGGLELALACDLILASDRSMLGLPETGLGIIPGLGGCIRLPRRVGLGRAKELIFSGRTVDAAEGQAIGLVDAVYQAEAFEEKTLEYAALLAAKSPASLALAKSTVSRGLDASLEAGLALEREAFAYCFALPDAKEGISAFLEKRKPEFS